MQFLGIFEFAAAIAVLVIEKDHAAVSTLSFRSAPSILLVAGILSIAAGSFLVIVTKCIEVTTDNVKKNSLIVSFSWGHMKFRVEGEG